MTRKKYLEVLDQHQKLGTWGSWLKKKKTGKKLAKSNQPEKKTGKIKKKKLAKNWLRQTSQKKKLAKPKKKKTGKKLAKTGKKLKTSWRPNP